jgi:uncharacterized protein YkwD
MVRLSRRKTLRATAGVIAGVVAGCNTPSDFTDTPTPTEESTPTPEPTLTPRPREPFDAAKGPHIDDVTPIEQHLHELLNDARRSRVVGGLTWDPALAYVGRVHARDMGRRDYLSHANKNGQGPTARLHEYGVWDYKETGENIAVSPRDSKDPKAIAAGLFEQWRGSEGHKENMLDPTYTYHGVGVYITETGLVYAAMMLGKEYPQPTVRGDAPMNWEENMKNWSNTPTYAPDSPMRNNSSE